MAQATSTKRVLIDKANSTIVLTTSIAVFLVVFSLVASKAMVSQLTYQNKVIDVKKHALQQLKQDLTARDKLVSSYAAFIASSPNIIGGNSTGNGDSDGDNAKIVLDALPSKYDFPALATSLEKILNQQGLQIQSIQGTDDEVAQQGNQNSAVPQPVVIPFQLTVTGNYQSIQNLAKTFENSIRPLQVLTMQISGAQSATTLTITAQTYYQPAKDLTIKSEVVK